MKGYKICDNKRLRKFGVGANSLTVLKQKAYLKFPIQKLRVYLSSDGSEVSDEDFFQSIPAQTLFVIAGSDVIITTDADYDFEMLRENSPLLKISDIICDFMEKHPAKFRQMVSVYERRSNLSKDCLTGNDEKISKTRLSLRSEHEEWFFGQEERSHSKEEAMARRAQDRVRTYFYKTKDQLTHNKLYRQNVRARNVIDSILEKFRYLLIGCDHFSMVFNRKFPIKHEFVKCFLPGEYDQIDARSQYPNKRLKQVIKDYTVGNNILDEWSVSLCTEVGKFYCQGAFSENGNCSLKHYINPYESRESLILFQVWNLDHQIELSRTILPDLMENVFKLVSKPNQKCKLHGKIFLDVSVLEYFLEIFSLKNLKLVHIVCHEKTQRENKSNGRLVCLDCHEYKIIADMIKLCTTKNE